MNFLAFSDIVATTALLVSTVAVWQTIKSNRRQRSLIESQERLNNLLLKKGEEEFVEDKRADIGATIVKLGSSKYRLKIWNKGKAAAKNVRISFPEGNDIVAEDEITEKFPSEILDTFESVELIAFVSLNTKRKHVIHLMWSDSFSENNEKTVYPTL
jgi:hypothetical protein